MRRQDFASLIAELNIRDEGDYERCEADKSVRDTRQQHKQQARFRSLCIDEARPTRDFGQ